MPDYTKPIMDPTNWPLSWAEIDLGLYRKDFVADQEAVDFIATEMAIPARALWLMGDGDVCWWGQESLMDGDDEVDRGWVERLSESTGLHPSDRKLLWEPMDAAFRNASTWLMQYRWEAAERLGLMTLRTMGATIDRLTGVPYYAGDYKKKVDCNALYRLPEYGEWWPMLAHRKIALIGGHTERLKSRLMDPEFVAASGGDEISWTIPVTLPCPPKGTPKSGAYFELCDQLGSTEWDLLLCSAGGLAVLLCDFAQRLGRNALDIGAMDVQLLSQDYRCDPARHGEIRS